MGVHGRDAELDRIAGLLDAARTARGGSLVVRGPAGAGKTTLLDAAAASAEGFLVVRATCAQSERSLPYAALHQALWPAMDAIDRLPAPQAGALRQAFGLAAGDRPERFAAAVGTLSLLAELATAGPLLCVVDDLQWADEASADALLFAGRRLGDEPVALLLGVRVEDAPALDGTVPVVDIAPLDADAALRLLEDKSGLGVSAAASGIRHPAVSLLAVVDRVEAGVAAGRHDVAAAGTAAAAEWARATELSAAAAIAAHCDAVCAAPGEAPVRFERALALHERHPRSFERARTELAYGRFLRRHRARARAREHLARAADRFDRLGASFWAKQARAELRATGASLRPRDPDARDSLTRQERRIAGYAATGLTNREIAARLFLSPRTVDFHLRNVFAKLGIASRTELARHPAIDVERADGGSPEPAG